MAPVVCMCCALQWRVCSILLNSLTVKGLHEVKSLRYLILVILVSMRYNYAQLSADIYNADDLPCVCNGAAGTAAPHRLC